MIITRKIKVNVNKAAPIAAIVLASVFLYTNLQHQSPGSIVINEVAFSQADSSDWIELYNPTFNNMSLTGLYLSDKAADLGRFEFKSNVTIPAHGYLLVNTKSYEGSATGPQTNFNISLGETIYLIGKDGSSIIDQLPIISSDESIMNRTIGRYPDGNSDIFLLSTATAGTANSKELNR